MKEYIFLTGEGRTLTPENDDIDNLQVVAFGNGESSREAWNNIVLRESFVASFCFKNIIAMELKEDKMEFMEI